MNTTEIKIDCGKVSRHKAPLTAHAGGQVLHVDEINPASAKARAGFLDALAARCPGLDRHPLEDRMLQIADLCAKQPEPKAGKGKHGTALALADPDPWPDEVDGAALLSDVAAVIRSFAILPQHAPEVLALWVLFAHVHDAFHVSPILLLTSPVKQCGKTRVLELLAGLLPRALSTSSTSPAGLFRAVESHGPTLLLDEVDAHAKEDEEMRRVLNSGWQRSTAYTMRVEGKDDRESKLFSTWCPKVLAMIGTPWDTVLDRSIVIRMQRKGPGEVVERWRADRGPAIMGPLCRRAARWAADHLEELRDADPTMPQIASDRAADNWRCLLAVADLAGGPWPELARSAAEAMSAVPSDDDSARILLLVDLRDLFATRSTGRLTSQEVADHLGELEERPWPEWKSGKPISKAQVARLLKPFGVKPGSIRLPTGTTPKGYSLAALEPVFAKYLSTPPVQNATTPQVGNDGGNQPNQNATRGAPDEPKAKRDPECGVVAAGKGGGGGSEPQRGFRFALGATGTTPSTKRIFVQDRTVPSPEEV